MKSNCICKKSEIPFRKFPLGENCIFSNPKKCGSIDLRISIYERILYPKREIFNGILFHSLIILHSIPLFALLIRFIKKKIQKKKEKMKKENERTRRLILHKWIDTGKTSNEVFIASSTRVHLSYRIGEICNKSGRVTHARRFIAGILIKNIF